MGNGINGCGPNWLPEKYKSKFFKDECDKHDRDYTYGKNKIVSDCSFLRDMLLKAVDSKDPKFRISQAYFYYFLVIWFGGMTYGDKK